jgi:hypothetical protein
MSGMTGLLECSVSSTTGGREWRVRGGCLILLRCLCPPQYGSSTLAVHTALIGISLTLILSAVSAFADTFVSGTITSNTTWTTNGSPYVVTSTPTVPSPWELTIRPGVVVESYANVMMVINGRLEARGDLDTPICFTNHPSQAHGGGILFLGGEPYAAGNLLPGKMHSFEHVLPTSVGIPVCKCGYLVQVCCTQRQ